MLQWASMDLILIVPGAILFAAIVLVALQQRGLPDAISEELANDPDVEAVPGRSTLSLRTRPPRRAATAVAAGRGRGSRRWDAKSQVRLEPHTTLSIAPAVFLGGLRVASGVAVLIGDEAFDRAFTVRGGDSEVVKQLLASREARFAVETLFAHEVDSLHIDAEGIATCSGRRDGLSVGQPKRLLRALVSLLDELEAASRRAGRRPSSGT